MGDSTGSMFYFFILILVIYFVGVGIYQLIQEETQMRKGGISCKESM